MKDIAHAKKKQKRLLVLGKAMAPFHAMVELKHGAQPKKLIPQIEMQKCSQRIVNYAYH